MDKLKMHSPNLTEANIDKLAELFPNCITEALDAKGELKKAIDFDLLRQELAPHIVEGPQERYQLNWPGKREALLAANTQTTKTLRPCREESVDFENTRNIFIEGDNLEVLKLLQENYLGLIKMIYIDPPYNTGKDFIYKDNYSLSSVDYEVDSGQRSEEFGRLVANPETCGRYHSDWLSMIYPRLKLARNLLRDDGFVFISIADQEVASLRRICDEIFGERNFIAQLIWNTEGHTDNQYEVKVNHEYIIVYAKESGALLGHVVDPNTRVESNLWKGYAENSITKNGAANPPSEIELPRGFPCLSEKVDLPSNSPDAGFFELVEKIGYITRQITTQYEVSYPIRLDRLSVENSALQRPCRVFSGWANSEKLKSFIRGGCKPIDEGDGNTLQFYLSVRGVIYYRRDREKAKNIVSVLRNMGTTEQMRSELEGMGIPFEYPKPKQLISYLLRMGAESESIVMDFFAGSCTTAHSIFETLLAKELKNIRFIVVQLPEKLDQNDPKQKPGYDFCESLGVPQNIAEISKERIRRVGNKIKKENSSNDGIEQLDIGFRVLKIDASNMKEVYYTPDAVHQDLLSDQVDNIREDRTAEDLLFQVLLDWGVDLALPINQQVIAGKTVFFVDGNALVACFDTGIDEDFVKQLAGHKPLRVVFRDAGFASDSVKINVEQVFKLLSPATEIKTL